MEEIVELDITKGELVLPIRCSKCGTVRRMNETVYIIALNNDIPLKFIGCKKCDEVFRFTKLEEKTLLKNIRDTEDQDFFDSSKVAMNLVNKLCFGEEHGN